MIAAHDKCANTGVASRFGEHRLSILIIQPWIRLGGAELISVYLAHNLHKMGHRTSIVCAFRELAGMPQQAGTLDYRTPPEWLSSLLKRSRLAFLVLAPVVLFAITWHNSKHVDVLNPHNAPTVWIAVIVGALRGKPIVWTCNEPPLPVPLRDLQRIGVADFLGWLIMSSWIDRILVRRVAGLYVPSEMTRNQVRDRYGLDAVVIPLGVDIEYFQTPSSDRESAISRFKGKYVLLAVGKLHPQKNQRVCVEAMREVLPKIPNAVLVLAGDGPMRDELKALAKSNGLADQVLFLGQSSAEVVRDLYHSCDINLVAATNQSWGLTPFEALCAGKISVASDDCGAAEILLAENIGFVCEPTARAFAKKVVQAYSTPEATQAMAVKGRRLVLEKLSWEAYAERVLILFESAVGIVVHATL